MPRRESLASISQRRLQAVKSKSIYVLPNAFTAAALFAAYYGIIQAMNGHFSEAAIAVFFSMLFDGMDGRVARLTHTQSEFGVQMDSLADAVSFGIAPALIVYEFALVEMGKIGWAVSFVYALCALLRLARFNCNVGVVSKNYFQGLPSPAAAALVCGFVWLAVENRLPDWLLPHQGTIAAVVTLYAGLTMVSNAPFFSGKSYAVVRSAGGNYRLTREEPVGAGRKGYFVVEASDRRNGVGNTFGLWRLALSADGKPLFEYRMDGFEQANSRCCDAVSYYPLQLTSRNEVIRAAQLAQSPACFYPVMEERGIIRTEAGQTRRIRIEAWDDCGNRSQLEFDILGRTESFRAKADSAATVLTPGRTGIVRLGREVTARIPAGALYEPVFCRAERCPAPASDSTLLVLTSGYRILPVTTPLHRAMTVSVRAFVPENLHPHTVLAARNAKGRLTCIGGKYADGAVTATTRTTGELFVVADTIPPRIRPLFTDGADLTRAPAMRFRVGDNFSGIASCTLFIDGKWLPCDRLPMQGTLIHLFEEPPARKSHSVRLTLTDACGNTACWEGTIRR